MAFSEKQGIFALVKRRACGAANPVAELVSGNRASRHRKQPVREQRRQRNIENPVRYDARGDEKRVSRQEKSHKKSRFHENDCADERRPGLPYKFLEFCRIEEPVKKVEKRFEHATWFLFQIAWLRPANLTMAFTGARKRPSSVDSMPTPIR